MLMLYWTPTPPELTIQILFLIITKIQRIFGKAYLLIEDHALLADRDPWAGHLDLSSSFSTMRKYLFNF